MTEIYGVRNPSLEAELVEARTPAQLNAAFRKFMDFERLTNLDARVRGHRLFLRGFDRTVPRIARKLGLSEQPRGRSNDKVVILATQFGLGGHTEVAADISRGVGPDGTTVILTDIYANRSYLSDAYPHETAAKFACRSFLSLRSPTLAERTVELHRLLLALNPTRIFLLNHYMDMVAVVGSFAFRSVIDFVHHADFSPCLGASLPYAAHVDLTYVCHLACSKAGLSPIYAGMTLPKPSIVDRPAGDRRNGRLRFGTAGGLHKYRQPGRHRWADWAVACLRTPSSDFVHIGNWNDAFASEVRQALADAQLDPERYVFVGPVPSVQNALIEQEVDIYVGSYPETGARSGLEALAASIPALMPTAPELGPLLRFTSPLPGWSPLEAPDDVEAGVARTSLVRKAMAGPEYRRSVGSYFQRFDDFVAGRPLDPVVDLSREFEAGGVHRLGDLPDGVEGQSRPQG